MNIHRVSVEETRQLISDGEITVLDIRDEQSYAAGHLPDALHLKAINIDAFIENQDKGKALLVYCYHGHSSIPAAGYFAEKGFRQCYSMDGGYEAWHLRGPGARHDEAGS